ncbi:MAG: response regulator [Thioalkalispiraceae bacterium]|jgi:two-component system response regulator RpfG
MSTVVIIDDQATTLKLLTKIITDISTSDKRIEVETFLDERHAVSWIKHHQVDLVVLDYKLPCLNGLKIIELIRMMPQHTNLPIIMVTALDDREILYRALDAGATDFLRKPIDYRECQARCRNLLHMREQQLQLQNINTNLQCKIEESLGEILQREKETLHYLARAGEFRDAETGYHITRISRYTYLIAKTIGLGSTFSQLIQHAAPMHDIGKIGIPDHILLKPGKLSPDEWTIMQTHTSLGYEILSGSSSEFMQMGASIALFHHEKFNGQGYPQGVAEDEIPIEARIVAVADVFDALTSIRPYKKAWTIQSAFEYLQTQAGLHFDPQCIEAFMDMRDEVEKIYNEYLDAGTNIAKDAQWLQHKI